MNQISDLVIWVIKSNRIVNEVNSDRIGTNSRIEFTDDSEN